jgi:hypothetical protein
MFEIFQVGALKNCIKFKMDRAHLSAGEHHSDRVPPLPPITSYLRLQYPQHVASPKCYPE